MTEGLCTDATCSAASFTSTDKLHERVCAPLNLRCLDPERSAHSRRAAGGVPAGRADRRGGGGEDRNLRERHEPESRIWFPDSLVRSRTAESAIQPVAPPPAPLPTIQMTIENEARPQHPWYSPAGETAARRSAGRRGAATGRLSAVRLRTRGDQGPWRQGRRVGDGLKLLEAAQDRWRAINGPHLVALVRAGPASTRG
jgi:hypothetical protein